MRISSMSAAAAIAAVGLMSASSASAAALARTSSALLGAPSPVTVTETLCTETDADGCVMALPIDPGTTAASDGEASFDPFGFGGDTSDGIALSSIWTTAVSTPTWSNIAGTNTWVIPGCVAGVCENGAVPEQIGIWAAPGFTLVGADLLQYNIYDSNGSLSDIVSLYNDASGTVNISFNSIVPEPSTWAMMLLGFGAVGAVARRRPRTAIAA